MDTSYIIWNLKSGQTYIVDFLLLLNNFFYLNDS
jgi:hypothetical protein